MYSKYFWSTTYDLQLSIVAHVSIVWHKSRRSIYCLLFMFDLLFIIYYFALYNSLFTVNDLLPITRATVVKQSWAPQTATSRHPPCFRACTLLQNETRTQFTMDFLGRTQLVLERHANRSLTLVACNKKSIHHLLDRPTSITHSGGTR